jgi:hypothetical protein
MLTHLQRLESETIHIMREVVAEMENPVMLYTIGKDSTVMLHLAKKAFWPAPHPFPLLHIDSTCISEGERLGPAAQAPVATGSILHKAIG